MTKENKLHLMLAIFVTALICANILGVKIISVFGMAVSVGIFMFPLTFLITDIVEEVEGREKTKIFIKAGAISLIIVFLYTALSVWLEPNARYTNDYAFQVIFKGSLRMIFASLVAFLIGQYHDIWAFDFWKKKTKGKYLWLRNNASTFISQLIDSTIFMFIAFYKFAPQYDAWFIIKLIIPYWLFKVLLAAIDTPFCYWGVTWLKGEKKKVN
ncbi:queuosine precursor transporter [Candidatus Kuenenbacteria bacterium]|nr:queuosine precursor transporter [Candidatus Kuenenbacteria bacterium]